jgi:hypothetical protein
MTLLRREMPNANWQAWQCRLLMQVSMLSGCHERLPAGSGCGVGGPPGSGER